MSPEYLADTTTSFVIEVYAVERIKTQILLKRNLKALLKHRGKTQNGLARILRPPRENDESADSWMSHILNEKELDRELPMELWDKAADYLGVDTYHFFIPGIAENDETERRSGRDRRTRADRRMGTTLPARPRDLDLMNLIRALPRDAVEEAIGAVMKILDRALQRRRAIPASGGDQGNRDETGATTPAREHARKKR